jgi:acyl-CoA thioesterase-1
MQMRWCLWVGALAWMTVLPGCRQVPNLDSPGHAIVCFGDSIAAGVGASAGHGFCDQVGVLVGSPVVTEAVPGDTASDGWARLDQVLADDPWLVIVELGGNDILRQVPIETTSSTLERIIERLLSARCVPLLVSVEGPFGGAHGDLYRRLGKRYRIPVVDALRGILFDPRLKADEVHPNDEGHALLARAVAAEVKDLMKARRRRRPA